jgi:hypothetical protein
LIILKNKKIKRKEEEGGEQVMVTGYYSLKNCLITR